MNIQKLITIVADAREKRMFKVTLKDGRTVEIADEEFQDFLQQNRDLLQQRQIRVRRSLMSDAEASMPSNKQ